MFEFSSDDKKLYFKQFLEMNNFENPHYYDRRFTNNILVLGQTGYGKNTFVQNLGKNKIFRELEFVDWVSKIVLDKILEKHIRSFFNYTKANFHHPDDISDFNVLIENFQSENTNTVEDKSWNIFREKIFENLIIMDGISGLLKIRIYLSVYFSHTLSNKMILSQTMIFEFFASSVQLGQMLRILTNICDRETICYISSRDLWINRLYFDVSNEKRHSCLTMKISILVLHLSVEMMTHQNTEQIQKITLNNFVIIHKKKEMEEDGRRPRFLS